MEESGDSSFTGLFGVLENAVVRNLAVENCFLESRTSGGLYAGVIAGKMQNSLVEDCYVSGKIVINGKTPGGAYRYGQDSGDTAGKHVYKGRICIRRMEWRGEHSGSGDHNIEAIFEKDGSAGNEKKEQKIKVVKPAKNGKMTPLAAGKAVITIKASGNEEYKAKTIKVKAEVFPKKPA